jgi:hypothetical protein
MRRRALEVCVVSVILSEAKEAMLGMVPFGAMLGMVPFAPLRVTGHPVR